MLLGGPKELINQVLRELRRGKASDGNWGGGNQTCALNCITSISVYCLPLVNKTIKAKEIDVSPKYCFCCVVCRLPWVPVGPFRFLWAVIIGRKCRKAPLRCWKGSLGSPRASPCDTLLSFTVSFRSVRRFSTPLYLVVVHIIHVV